MANCKVLTSGPHFLLLTCPKNLPSAIITTASKRVGDWGGWGASSCRQDSCEELATIAYCPCWLLAGGSWLLAAHWEAVKLLLVYFKLWKICANARQPADITQWYLTRPNKKEQPFLPLLAILPEKEITQIHTHTYREREKDSCKDDGGMTRIR